MVGCMGVTDEHLVSAYRSGDTCVLEELLRRHGGSLLGYLTRMLGNRTDAEDVFQETFRRLLGRLDRFDTSRRFKPWLYAIAHNAAVDALRRRGRRPEQVSLDRPISDDGSTDERLLADPALTPVEELEAEDRRAAVREAIELLSPRQKACLVLVYYHDMSYADTAEALACSIGTVKTHMSRALKALARHLPEPLAGRTGGP